MGKKVHTHAGQARGGNVMEDVLHLCFVQPGIPLQTISSLPESKQFGSQQSYLLSFSQEWAHPRSLTSCSIFSATMIKSRNGHMNKARPIKALLGTVVEAFENQTFAFFSQNSSYQYNANPEVLLAIFAALWRKPDQSSANT